MYPAVNKLCGPRRGVCLLARHVPKLELLSASEAARDLAFLREIGGHPWDRKRLTQRAARKQRAVVQSSGKAALLGAAADGCRRSAGRGGHP
jgi:hypothetical protein